MMDASAPYVRYKPLFVRMKERCMNIIESSNSSVRSVFPKKSVATPHPKKSLPSENIDLNLQPGDWVQVKSLDEIYQTLDEKKKLKGLFFMPEMEKFCGKKFRVFKRAEIIKLEPSGEIRKLKTPSVFLEGHTVPVKKGMSGVTVPVFTSGEKPGLKEYLTSPSD